MSTDEAPPRADDDPAPLGEDLTQVPAMLLGEEAPIDVDVSKAKSVEGPPRPQPDAEDPTLWNGLRMHVPKSPWYKAVMFKLPSGSVLFGLRGPEGLQALTFSRGGRPPHHLAKVVEVDFEDARQLCKAERIPFLLLPESGAVVASPRDPPPIDYGALAKALRLEGKPTQAALVDYMATREEADHEEIAEHVHGDKQTSHSAMWNNAQRTSDSLAGMGSRLSFRYAASRMYREISSK